MESLISYGENAVGIGSDFILLDYITTTGTQYIDTLWHPKTHNIKVEIKCTPSTQSQNTWGFASIYADSNWCNPWGNAATKERFYVASLSGVGERTVSYSTAYSYILTCTGTSSALSSAQISVDGSIIYVNSSASGTFVDNLSGNFCIGTTGAGRYMYTRKNGTSSVPARYYYCRLYEDYTLMHNLLPVRRKTDNVIGMYDTVTKMFYQNAGTGAFGYGSEITSVTYVDYLQTTGTQWIDTGWCPSSHTTETEIKCTPSQQSKNAWGFCSAFGDTKWYNPYGRASGYETFAIGSNDNRGYTSVDYNTAYIFKLTTTGTTTCTGITITRDGTSLYSYSGDCGTFSDAQMGSFCIGSTGSNMSTTRANSGKYYYCKLTQDGILMHDLYPAKLTDGTLGMYDTITHEFYTNAGSGTFSYGSELSTTVNPTIISSTPTENRFDLELEPLFHPEIISGQSNLFSSWTTSYNFQCEYAHQYRIGNLVTLYLGLRVSAAATVGTYANVMTGVYKGILPDRDVETFSYNYNHGFGLRLEPSGAITVRHNFNVSYTYGVGTVQYFSLTYMVKDI